METAIEYPKGIISNKDKGELYRRCADAIADAIKETLLKKKTAVLAICGGRSAPGVFGCLKARDIEWKRVHIFMADERLVPIYHEESNYRLARKSFIDSLVRIGDIPEDNVHPFIYDLNERRCGTDYYAERLKEFGGVFDVVLLSSGEDCHIAALYPDHHSIKSKDEFFITMNDSPKPPSVRMSASASLISKSSHALLLIIGDKKDALHRFVKESDDEMEHINCPSMLVKRANNFCVFTDVE